MSRNLLHKTKLDDFKAWLDKHNYPNRPGRGEWQVLQVLKEDDWCAVYERVDMPEHLTVDKRIDRLVWVFLNSKKSDALRGEGEK